MTMSVVAAGKLWGRTPTGRLVSCEGHVLNMSKSNYLLMTTNLAVQEEAADRYGYPPGGTADVETLSVAFDLGLEEAMDVIDRFDENGTNSEFIWRIGDTIDRYAESYDQDTLASLAGQLRTGNERDSVGDDLWQFLASPQSDLLAEDAEEYLAPVVERLESHGIEDEIETQLDGIYAEAAQELVDGQDDRLDRLARLEAIVRGEEIGMQQFDTLQWLRGKQANPNDDLERIDMDDLYGRFEDDIDSMVRARTIDALEQQAQERAADMYMEITGERTEMDDDMVYAVRAWMMTEEEPFVKGEESVLGKLEKLIEHGTEAYWEIDPGSTVAKDGPVYYEQPVIETLRQGPDGPETYEIGGEEIEIYVADPIEALRYGEEFRTCRSIEWDDPNQGTVNRAASLPAVTLYAEKEDGSIVGRMNLTYVEDDDGQGELEGGPIYRGLEDTETNEMLAEAMEEYAEDMRKALAAHGDEYLHDRLHDIYEREGEWIAPDRAQELDRVF